MQVIYEPQRRLEALRLAVTSDTTNCAENIVIAAESFYDFLTPLDEKVNAGEEEITQIDEDGNIVKKE